MPEGLQHLLGTYGYPLLFVTIFLNNSGLPVPGDTLLLGGGLLAQQGTLSLPWVIAVGALACFSGCTLGYWLGHRLGRRIILHSPWFRLSPERVDQMEVFLRKHGAKTIFFSRFVALLHPVTGILTGIGKTPFLPFLAYNLAGSIAYAICYALLGYFFGHSWEILKHWVGRGALYALAVLVIFVLLTLLLRYPLSALFSVEARKGAKWSGFLSELRHKIFGPPRL